MHSPIFLLIYLFLFPKILSYRLLKKYSSEKFPCSEANRIVFDSKEFNLNEEMYFTFKLDNNGLQDTIYYDFYEEINIEDSDAIGLLRTTKMKEPQSSSTTKTNKKVTSLKKYYKIQKDINNDFLLIDFTCHTGTLTIENTKEDEQKKNNVIIIVVVCVIAFLVILFTVIACIRRKKRRLERAAMQASAAGYYAQAGMAMGMSMVPPYGSSYMMPNMPPSVGLGGQPIAYSRVGNDVTQLAPNTPNGLNPQPQDSTSAKRIKVKKIK